ncbi:hypothetical protein DFJ73DRAFT_789099 [Zopfochytrium polystomum]|nr:hypothetical protein DFJ73DRAFT_789099 [Zopfochytrium polystomum]
MTINLQISIQTLRIHVTAAVALFIALYAVLVISLEQVYNTPELQIYPVAMSLTNVRVEKCAPGANQYLQSLTLWSDTNLCLKATKVHIDWAAEATVMCCILLVGLSLHMLQAFIQEYAFNLIDRQNQVSKLSKQNEDLKTQLDSLKKEIVLDLDSPITKVIRSIKNIQEKCDLGADVMESLDYVIQILSSNQLFLPNLNVNNDAMDSDVNKWLTTMLTNKADNGPSTLPTLEEAPSVIDDHILEYLSEINSWDFDIFKLVELTNGAPLYYLALAVIERHNLMPLFSLEPDVIKKFLRTIESGYKPVPYHNSTHAADVLHALHYFIAELGLSEIINSEEILACVVAAAIHDYAHPGVNNAFLINSGAPQALRYNDIAVLENFHCSSAFELMIADPSVNILGSLSRDRFKQVRASILSMVLATDMAGHFEYIAKFKNKLSGSGLQYEDAKDRQLLMDIAIKCGDINNAAKNLDLCRTWAGRIMEEFFQQGDLEKARALPVSMFMDRVTTEVPKCQVGFIDYLAMPLYEVWGLYATKEELAFAGLSNMAKNREYWRR